MLRLTPGCRRLSAYGGSGKAGGMPPTHFSQSSKPPSGRYLSFAEREEIAILRAQGHGVGAIARQLNRPPCTIYRELERNAARRHGAREHRATTAQWHADGPLDGQSRRSWRLIQSCEIMCKTGLPVLSPGRTGCPSSARRSCGKAAGPCIDSTDAGRRHGARKEFVAFFGSTSPRMRRCASVTRRSIRHFMCKVEERCAVNCRPACAPVGRCGLPQARTRRLCRDGRVLPRS